MRLGGLLGVEPEDDHYGHRGVNHWYRSSVQLVPLTAEDIELAVAGLS